MTSHDVCRQHRPLFRPEQWPAAFPVACQAGGSEGASSTAGEGGDGVQADTDHEEPAPVVPEGGNARQCRSWAARPAREGRGTGQGRRRSAGYQEPWTGSGGPPDRSPVTPWMSVSQAARPQAGLGLCDHLLCGWCDRWKFRRRASPGLLPRWGRAPCT